MEADLQRAGLTQSSLTVGSTMEDMATFLVAISTSVVFSRIIESISPQRVTQYTLIVTVFTLLLNWIYSKFLQSSISQGMYTYSAQDWELVMWMMRCVRGADIFLLTHFVSTAFIAMWTSMETDAAETFALIFVSFMTIRIAVQIIRKAQR